MRCAVSCTVGSGNFIGVNAVRDKFPCIVLAIPNKVGGSSFYGLSSTYNTVIGVGKGCRPFIFNGTALFDKERILVSIPVGTENQCILTGWRCNANHRRRIIDHYGVPFALRRVIVIVRGGNSKIVGSVGCYRTGIKHTIPAQRLRQFNSGFCFC